ncbi:MAG: hypothetical protein QGG40_00265 [Myxococcota bacterium]|jgi:hypothetical protein|nr:hypothetical protein [Myxococcota bacterium]
MRTPGTELYFVGSDGIWLYVNGTYLGHWGGEWREGGCINVPEGCSVNYEVAPIDITDYLQAGSNVVAVMLTNGPTGYYLEMDATCVE